MSVMAEAGIGAKGRTASPLATFDKTPRQTFEAPGQLLQAAEALIAKSHFDLAEQYLSSLGRYGVLASRVQLLRARMAISQGETDKGQQMLLEIAQKFRAAIIPADLAIYPASRILKETGAAAALKFLDQIRTIADPRAATMHAKLLARAHRLPEAATLVGLCSMRSPFPEKAQLVFLYGRLSAMQRDYPRALLTLGRALNWMPPDWRLFFRAARVAEKAANWMLAERWLGLALSFGGPSPVISQMLGRVRLAAGNIPGAVVAYRGARSMSNGVANQLQVVGALFQRGFYPQALREVESILAEMPRCLEAKRLQIEILLAMGRIHVVRATIEEFAAANANMPEIQRLTADLRAVARDRQELAEQREVFLLEQPIPPAFRLHEADLERRSGLGLLDGLKRQMNVIGAMIIRETVTRFTESKIGYLWAVIEPTVQVAFLVLIFLIGSHKVPYGMSIGLFIATGMLPFLFFMNTYSRTSSALRFTGGMLAHPSIKPLDLVFSATFLQAALDFTILVIFIIAIILYGDIVRIQNPLEVGFCILMLWCTGLGLGMAIHAFSQRFHWVRLLGWAVVRKLFFASGLFFVPEMLPSWLEKLAMYNPLLNIVMVIRSNFSRFVHTPGLSLSYGVKWCLAVLLFGFMAHTSTRRK
jgi:capsular polysaccharide transport system permease protein